jgi:hypothetical protein
MVAFQPNCSNLQRAPPAQEGRRMPHGQNARSLFSVMVCAYIKMCTFAITNYDSFGGGDIQITILIIRYLFKLV